MRRRGEGKGREEKGREEKKWLDGYESCQSNETEIGQWKGRRPKEKGAWVVDRKTEIRRSMGKLAKNKERERGGKGRKIDSHEYCLSNDGNTGEE
jgi:hypothetical protein